MSVRNPTGRLIKLRQRERRAQLKTPCLLSLAVGDFDVHIGNGASDTLVLGASLGSAPATYELGNGDGDRVLRGRPEISESILSQV